MLLFQYLGSERHIDSKQNNMYQMTGALLVGVVNGRIFTLEKWQKLQELQV